MNRSEVAATLTTGVVEPGYTAEEVVRIYQEIMALLPTSASPRSTLSQPSAVGNNDDDSADWEDLLANPLEWWDNRETKKNPRGPDFSHKTRLAPNSTFKVGLWLHSAPEHIKGRIGVAQAREQIMDGPPPQYLEGEEPF